ncbi:hypothetical protein VN23_18790 [Janthinobacterium sp. B9-8]|nr:hypothetical protein VN23_18790 [Janthinobacterium sp. B9-8]
MHGIEMLKSEKLDDWEGIFERWIQELDKILEITDGLEAPYVHCEHGNTHHFGVSAAMEGYATIREVMGKRNDFSARLDLALVSDRYLDIVESKWWEFSLLRLPSKSIIKDKMSNACADAQSYSSNEKLFSGIEKTIRRIGIAFFTPHYLEGESFDEVRVSELISFIKLSVCPDIIAWSFPEKSRNLEYWHRKYPGVIAVVKLNETNHSLKVADPDGPEP